MHSSIRRLLEAKGGFVHKTDPDTSVVDAVNEMNHAGIGALLVMEADRPVGVFTERDVLTRVVAPSRDPRNTSVREVMTRELIVIGPSITVEEAMHVVTEKRVRHLPVIENGRLLGMVSSGDLTRWVSKDLAKDVEELFHYIHGPFSVDGGGEPRFLEPPTPAGLEPSAEAPRRPPNVS